MISSETADLPDAKKAAASHATDFEPPIYNVWKQQEKTAGGKVMPPVALKMKSRRARVFREIERRA